MKATWTLVNAKEGTDGTLVETQERTNVWAWKRPSQDGQALTYVQAGGRRDLR